jgi:hypothetical protein
MDGMQILLDPARLLTNLEAALVLKTP